MVDINYDRNIGNNDASVRDVIEQKINGDEQKINSAKKELMKDEIDTAKVLNSPLNISEKYAKDLQTIGPLFQYQVAYDDNGRQIFQDVNGIKKPVYQKDINGNFVLKSEVKWDNNIQYDIRRGMEAYDDYAKGITTHEPVDENTIKSDSALNKLADIILEEAINDKAEDTMIIQYEHFGVVRRFDGQNFINTRIIYKSAVDPLITILKSRAGLKIKLTNAREAQTNGQLIYNNTSFRVAADSNQYGMFMNLRQQAKSFNDLDELGMPDNVKSVVRHAISGKDGLMVIGGPPGSGKTTLMTTGLVEFQRKTSGAKNILSLEQPIEIPVPGIIQKDIDEDYGVTWDNAISAALREKPQILRIGETSTEKSAKALLRASNAGIVSMTTLHMLSALESFETLKGLGVSENDIKNSLKLIVYLNRVPKLCTHCRIKQSIALHSDINLWIKIHLNDNVSGSVGTLYFRNKEGCEYCRKNQTNAELYGTMGTVGIYEYLKVNKPMLRIYRKYSGQDMYVLKDKLLHPNTIDWDLEKSNSGLTKDEIQIKNKDISAGLEYYALETDILSNIIKGNIDIDTAKYLLNA